MVSSAKCKDRHLARLLTSLSAAGGNVFATEFRDHLGGDNWKMRGPRTFFTDINHVRTTSSFLMPRGDLTRYKDFFIPLFVVCALWDPDMMCRLVLNDDHAATDVRAKFLSKLFH